VTKTVEAIYENGALWLQNPLPLPEKSHVRITIEVDLDREQWRQISQASLLKVWDNPDDDVFNELLSK
jgi:predicted DNA-binding antitoxin AbrB/MazE fold protein